MKSGYDNNRQNVHGANSLVEIKMPDQPASPVSIFAFTTKRHLTILFPAFVLAAMAGAVRPVVAIFLGYIFDELVNFGAGISTKSDLLHSVSTWAISLAGVGVATLLANGAFFSLWLIFGEMQARNASEMAFVSMLEKDVEWYDLCPDGIGSLLIRIQTQVRELQTACSQPLGFAIEVTAAALAALGIAFYNSWDLTLIVLACIPITVVVLSLITRRLQPAIEQQKRNLNAASRCSHAAIKAVDTVKVFNAQDYEVWKYACAIKRAGKSYMIQAHANSEQMGITRFMTTAMFVVGFWYGAFLVKQGLNPGRMLTTFYSCLMATQAVEQLLPQWLVLTRGISAGKNLRDIVKRMQRDSGTDKTLVGDLTPRECCGDVDIRNVGTCNIILALATHADYACELTFSYPSTPGQPAIRNASLFFPAGETTFVIGGSGSGKSTLGNLLLKYYQPTSGNLLIDGNPLQTLNVEWLRNNISLVQQESVLFNETMFRNILIGRRRHISVTEADFKIACQMAMLQDTINHLPNGLATMLGLGGKTLSGGQKQQVAIARARLRDSPILFLDEATSALDHFNRSRVIENIRRWRRGKTTIIITHDTSEIMDDDYVYVLDHGQVVQQGYKRHLMREIKGSFASFEQPNTNFQPKDSCSNLIDGNSNETSSSEPVGNPIRSLLVEDILGKDRAEQQPRSHSRHVSDLLGIDSESSYKSKRISRLTHGIGIAHLYMQTLRTENVWGDPSSPSTSRPYQISLDKPLPTLPSHRYSWHFRSIEQQSSSMKPEDIELLYMRAQVAKIGRKGMNRWLPSAEHWSSTTRPPSNIAALLAPEDAPDNVPKETNKSPNSHPKSATITYIFGTIWPTLGCKDRLRLVYGFSSALISAVCTPVFSYLLARLLSNFDIASVQSGDAEKWALCILGIAIVDSISTYFMHYLLEHCGQRWVDHFRVQALTRILAQPQAWFDNEKNNPGHLNECLDRNAEEMRNILGRFAGIVFLATSMTSIAIIWAFVVCWKLTLVGLAGAPLMYAFTRAFEVVSVRWEKRINEMAENIERISFEALLNIKVIRALTLENYFKKKHGKAVQEAYKMGTRRALYTGLLFGISDSTNAFVTALVLYSGAVVAASRNTSVQDILLVITLLLFSSGNVNSAMTFIPQIGSSRTTATYLLHLANMPSKASHESCGTKYLESPLPIKLNSLSFAHPGQPTNEILHKISMSFEKNSCTAIVGPSGSGKSTLVSLLLGLYPPNEPLHPRHASLTFASTSIFSCNLSSLRSQMAFVSQHAVLFPLTIAENITYGLCPSSALTSRHNMIAAARDVGIHDFVMSLPCGYETRIGDGGQGVSGGQAQRIAIARALVRRPKVLILDEPTAALDAESARVIREAIRRLVQPDSGVLGSDDGAASRSCGMVGGESPGMRYDSDQGKRKAAVILITHSTEMMKVADKIIMLDGGRVVEQGQFEELYRARGPFWRLISGRN